MVMKFLANLFVCCMFAIFVGVVLSFFIMLTIIAVISCQIKALLAMSY